MLALSRMTNGCNAAKPRSRASLRAHLPLPYVTPQVSVSGRVANNSAVMPNATLGYPCSAVFVIDTVLLPAPTLADIPPFSAIRAPPQTMRSAAPSRVLV